MSGTKITLVIADMRMQRATVGDTVRSTLKTLWVPVQEHNVITEEMERGVGGLGRGPTVNHSMSLS